MSCDVNNGRSIKCGKAIAGLLNVYFVNYGATDFGDASERYNATTEEIISPATPPEPLPDAYKYELHLGNDLTQNIQSSPENGTLYFEQILNLTLKKLSAEDNVNVRTLANGRPQVFVEDQMGNIMLVGRVNGSDITGGTAVTGNDYGDLNGYTLAFTGKEKTLANFYEAPAEGEASAFFTDFNVVVGVAV